MKFDLFVLPFISGLIFTVVLIIYKFIKWISLLPANDKTLLRQHFLNKTLWASLKEIISESLLHRNIFKTNPKLGYMHMSLAFGWFLLIVLGNIEIKFYSEYTINPPYVPIFLKFFEPTPLPHFFGRGSSFLMDLLLLMILSAVALAFYKRFNSKALGIHKTTKHNTIDRIALTALWFVFPLRLLAESFTSGIYENGSFLTGSLGHVFDKFLPLEYLVYPTWWAYSIALGTFFFALPFSRYMHIPSEVLLILMRNAGIKTHAQKTTFTDVEINSCSRCGICIDACQLSNVLNINTIQPSYFIRDVRYNHLNNETVSNCLMCGRCNNACPVGINTTEIRLAQRIENNKLPYSDYSFISATPAPKTDVLYFAGCMTHLTPTIKRAMSKILDKSAVNWKPLDENGGICCGRPLLLSGQLESARVLIDKNKDLIKNSGAKTLVTSCPICLKAFKEDYNLNIEVVHHSQFILQLIENELITIKKSNIKAIYHDPCELARGCNITYEPCLVINHTAELIPNDFEKENGLCCGGSLGNMHLSHIEKNKLAHATIDSLGIAEAECLITACPLCKKTFQQATEKDVKDLAEVVAEQMVEKNEELRITVRESPNIELCQIKVNK